MPLGMAVLVCCMVSRSVPPLSIRLKYLALGICGLQRMILNESFSDFPYSTIMKIYTINLELIARIFGIYFNVLLRINCSPFILNNYQIKICICPITSKLMGFLSVSTVVSLFFISKIKHCCGLLVFY